MIPQSKAKMFPAIECGTEESGKHRSYYTFNFGKYQHCHRAPFGDLMALNVEVLAPLYSLSFKAETSFYLVLIPVIGAVNYDDERGKKAELVAGYLQVFLIIQNHSFSLSNPYHDEAVSFIQVRIRTLAPNPLEVGMPLSVLLDENINSITRYALPSFQIALGKFEGRQDGCYSISKKGRGIFAFLLQGHMEMQYRLLERGDGVSFWEQDCLEFEALSSSGIVLFIEVNV